jgi:hypothetical protein
MCLFKNGPAGRQSGFMNEEYEINNHLFSYFKDQKSLIAVLKSIE